MSQVVLAFSGGLDTSWCVPHLQDQGFDVVTVTVDTGFTPDELIQIEAQSAALGAAKHITVDAKRAFFDEVLRHLIAGNVRKGGVYPLCVGAERAIQARESARVAKELGADAIAHGSTAAGNDQIRFEVVLRTLAPDLKLLAPIRDLGPKRPDQVADLEAKGLPIPGFGAAYSVNAGLWGVTIGGTETKTSGGMIPEAAWVRTAGAFDFPKPARALQISFEQGIPTALDGMAFDPVRLIETLDTLAASYGIGRGMHLGETILGIKGRVAFEAPAATVILAAHQELEKLVLTGGQLTTKDCLAATYGDYVHRGLWTDPLCRNIEAFLRDVQVRVTGTVTVELALGRCFVAGCDSPHSLMAASRGEYGEAIGEWTSADAIGFSRIFSLPSELSARAGRDQ